MTKPHVVPIPIVVDSREKKPYLFEDEVIAGLATVTRAALPAGDYSLLTYETRVAIERKSLDDFVSTILNERERFSAELRKLEYYQDAAIVVEATLSDITAHRYTSSVSPLMVLGSAMSIQSLYGIPIIWAGDRVHASLAVRACLWAFLRKVNKE